MVVFYELFSGGSGGSGVGFRDSRQLKIYQKAIGRNSISLPSSMIFSSMIFLLIINFCIGR